ncbi:DEKNAAC103050 [Brettanomyces naardenensis]|uniref:DEKNAAC103050 n=1 Tax=Brettanomyces naardenensis TaxID=13370 RepID=A0A448YMA1_BRENA|nr:DEKNAAC103050 [Brettanomyces naardenensis]
MSQEVFNEGPTTSQHIESSDDDYFKKTTFKLKRTRSMGLLDDFITQAHSMDAESVSQPSDNQNKITSRDFVSDATLQKLNIIPPDSDETLHVPGFYTNVIPNVNHHRGSSDGSFSTISLTPKHELKRQEMLQDDKIRQHHIDLIASHALHDDTDVEDRPQQHVDYLSHQWQAEDEVLRCWRYVVMKKHDFADAARLENASWRTWAQTRNHLSTISPEELNWSKDADVTWLYGPAFREEKPISKRVSVEAPARLGGSRTLPSHNTVKQSTSTLPPQVSQVPQVPQVRPLSASPEHLKSILKKRSNVENLIGDGSYSRLQTLLEEREHKFNGSPILESTSSQALNASPYLIANQRETPSPLLLSASQTREDFTTPSVRVSSPSSAGSSLRLPSPHGISLQKSSLKKRDPLAASKPERHIHFSMRVDQCIAVDDEQANEDSASVSSMSSSGSEVSMGPADANSNFPYTEESEQTFNEYYSGGDSSSMDEDSSSLSGRANSGGTIRSEGAYSFDNYDTTDDGFVFKPSSMPNHSAHRRLPLSSHHRRSLTSIAPLPSTTLKTCSDDEEQNERSMYTVSHNTRTNRGYEYYYDYNTVYSNDSNPVYNVIADNDVEMVDVPQDFQMDDPSMSDGSVPAVLDVPASISVDLPRDIDIGMPHMVVPAAIPANNGPLKRTTSVGNSSSHSHPSQNVSNIKVGLSGLNLGSSGLKGSMGAGSKAQLFQLADQQQKQKHHSTRRGSQASQSSKRTFVFDSDSDSSADESASSSGSSFSTSSGSRSSSLPNNSIVRPGRGSFDFHNLPSSSSDEEEEEGLVLNAVPRSRSFVSAPVTVFGTTNATAVSSDASYDKKRNSYASLASLAAGDALNRRKQGQS